MKLDKIGKGTKKLSFESLIDVIQSSVAGSVSYSVDTDGTAEITVDKKEKNLVVDIIEQFGYNIYDEFEEESHLDIVTILVER